jgi:hypothetical protein
LVRNFDPAYLLLPPLKYSHLGGHARDSGDLTYVLVPLGEVKDRFCEPREVIPVRGDSVVTNFSGVEGLEVIMVGEGGPGTNGIEFHGEGHLSMSISRYYVRMLAALCGIDADVVEVKDAEKRMASASLYRS